MPATSSRSTVGVVTASEIAEDAGAAAVMALERVPPTSAGMERGAGV
ncbi:MAG TPA: hypothetical protein VIH85_15975 [Solirubrobacteraceae bacterium]